MEVSKAPIPTATLPPPPPPPPPPLCRHRHRHRHRHRRYHRYCRSGYVDGEYIGRHHLDLTLEQPFFVTIRYQVEYAPRLDEPSDKTALVFQWSDTKGGSTPAVSIDEWFPSIMFGEWSNVASKMWNSPI